MCAENQHAVWKAKKKQHSDLSLFFFLISTINFENKYAEMKKIGGEFLDNQISYMRCIELRHSYPRSEKIVC